MQNNSKLIFNGKPTGGLGNLLFQYNLINQIANKKNLSTPNFNLTLNKLFNKFGPKLNTSIMNHRKHINPRFLDSSQGIREYYNSLEETISNEKNITYVIPVGLLGECFSIFTEINPKEIFKVKEKKLPIFSNKKRIGVHFRGGDFKNWNSNAILPINYYVDGTDALIYRNNIKDIEIFPSTDDKTLETYNAYCNKYHEFIPVQSNSFDSDFITLASCNYLISSPSTYAIWAGILGNQLEIFHYTKWVDERAEKGDIFWQDMRNAIVPFYKVKCI